MERGENNGKNQRERGIKRRESGGLGLGKKGDERGDLGQGRGPMVDNPGKR